MAKLRCEFSGEWSLPRGWKHSVPLTNAWRPLWPMGSVSLFRTGLEKP